MPPAIEMLSANEAALVASVARRDVDRMIDEHILPDSLVVQGHGRRVAANACMYISFWYETASQLTAEARRFAIRSAEPKFSDKWVLLWKKPAANSDMVIWHDTIGIDMAPFARATSDRFKRLSEARAIVATDPDILSGTPVIRGTRIPVHDIAASVRAGVSEADILAAYPGLNAETVALATVYANANPLMGRKRKVTLPVGARTISSERVERFTPIQ